MKYIGFHITHEADGLWRITEYVVDRKNKGFSSLNHARAAIDCHLDSVAEFMAEGGAS